MKESDARFLEEMTGLVPMMLTGRCANGAQRDRGSRAHLASGQTGPALCGQGDGRLSGGWVKVDREVDCPRCVRRLPRELASLRRRVGRERA